MFTATKLRRGMIPKDKEGGDVNVERGVTRENYVSPPPLVIFLLLVEAAIGWQEDHCHAMLALLSTTRGLFLPTPSVLGCSSSSCRTRNKNVLPTVAGGSLPLSHAIYWSAIHFFSSTQRIDFCLHALDCVLFSFTIQIAVETIGISFLRINGIGVILPMNLR